MAITSRRTGLIRNPITPTANSLRTGLIWLLDSGEETKESHRGVGSYNATQGDALNGAGNRSASRELMRAKNTRAELIPPPPL